MNNKQLKIEINHILERGANDVRLIELFERYAQTETSATEILRLKDADAHNEEIQHYQTQLTSANKRIEFLEEVLRNIAEQKYPESVFPPISDEDFNSVKNYCEQILYIPLDRLSAHYGRIFQNIFSELAQSALK